MFCTVPARINYTKLKHDCSLWTRLDNLVETQACHPVYCTLNFSINLNISIILYPIIYTILYHLKRLEEHMKMKIIENINNQNLEFKISCF